MWCTKTLLKKGLEGKIFGEKNFKNNQIKNKTQFLKKGSVSFFEVNSKGGYYGWGLLPQYKPPFYRRSQILKLPYKVYLY